MALSRWVHTFSDNWIYKFCCGMLTGEHILNSTGLIKRNEVIKSNKEATIGIGAASKYDVENGDIIEIPVFTHDVNIEHCGVTLLIKWDSNKLIFLDHEISMYWNNSQLSVEINNNTLYLISLYPIPSNPYDKETVIVTLKFRVANMGAGDNTKVSVVSSKDDRDQSKTSIIKYVDSVTHFITPLNNFDGTVSVGSNDTNNRENIGEDAIKAPEADTVFGTHVEMELIDENDISKGSIPGTVKCDVYADIAGPYNRFVGRIYLNGNYEYAVPNGRGGITSINYGKKTVAHIRNIALGPNLTGTVSVETYDNYFGYVDIDVSTVDGSLFGGSLLCSFMCDVESSMAAADTPFVLRYGFSGSVFNYLEELTQVIKHFGTVTGYGNLEFGGYGGNYNANSMVGYTNYPRVDISYPGIWAASAGTLKVWYGDICVEVPVKAGYNDINISIPVVKKKDKDDNIYELKFDSDCYILYPTTLVWDVIADGGLTSPSRVTHVDELQVKEIVGINVEYVDPPIDVDGIIDILNINELFNTVFDEIDIEDSSENDGVSLGEVFNYDEIELDIENISNNENIGLGEVFNYELGELIYLTGNVSNNSYGSISGLGTYYKDAQRTATLTAVLNDGVSVVGWSIDSISAGAGSSIDVTLDNSHYVYLELAAAVPVITLASLGYVGTDIIIGLDGENNTRTGNNSSSTLWNDLDYILYTPTSEYATCADTNLDGINNTRTGHDVDSTLWEDSVYTPYTPTSEYVTSNLVAMFDGINNTLSGHSSTTLEWEDIDV